MWKPGRKNRARELGEQEQSCRKRKNRANRRRKSPLQDLFLAAVLPQKRAVMSKAMARRRRRAGYAYTAVRTVIRYLNARERTTIYRHP